MDDLQQARAKAEALAAKVRSYQRTHFEGDDMRTPHCSDLASAIREVQDQAEAAFWAEWTADVFAARRAEWNAHVVNTKTFLERTALEVKLGYEMRDLAKAKARYVA